MADFYLKANDHRPSIYATLKDANGVAVNLTGYTSALIIFRPKDRRRPSWTGSLAVVSAAAGTVRYDPVAADTAAPGDYDFEFQITNGGFITTYPNRRSLLLTIVPEAGSA